MILLFLWRLAGLVTAGMFVLLAAVSIWSPETLWANLYKARFGLPAWIRKGSWQDWQTRVTGAVIMLAFGAGILAMIMSGN